MIGQILVAVLLPFLTGAAFAQAPNGPPLGPDAGRCAGTAGPAFLVRVTGLKNAQGTVRVRLFGGSADTYFDREQALGRIQIPVPATAVFHICVPVPRPGVYALDVRHDVNGDDKTSLSDGGGVSGNPRPSLWSILTRRKPSPATVQVTADNGIRLVPITVLYLRDGRFQSGSD